MEISKNEYFEILGLMVLAKKHLKMLEDIEKAIRTKLQDEEYSHTSDIVYDNQDADLLLERLEITVRE